MALKFKKVRDVIIKLVEDEKDMAVINDNEVNEMIIGLTTKEFFDEKRDLHMLESIRTGDTIINVVKHPIEIAGNIAGIKINGFKKANNHLVRVEVLTIARRRVYDIYEVRKNMKD